MTEIQVDIQLFIDKIKNYPEIWNVAYEDYHNRTKKRAARIKVCEKFYENYEK